MQPGVLGELSIVVERVKMSYFSTAAVSLMSSSCIAMSVGSVAPGHIDGPYRNKTTMMNPTKTQTVDAWRMYNGEPNILAQK